MQDLRIRFREREKIRYAQAKVDTDSYPLTSDNDLSLKLFLSDLEIEQIESDAIDQNLTTLRNRVNELGVSEPIVQRQGKKRIVVQLPGIQDTAEAKNILGKTATLEFHLEAQMDTPDLEKHLTLSEMDLELQLSSKTQSFLAVIKLQLLKLHLMKMDYHKST